MSQRFKKHQWWIFTVAIATPFVALAAGAVPHLFSSGTPIASSQVNADFKNVTDRLDELESKLAAVTAATKGDINAKTAEFSGRTRFRGGIDFPGRVVLSKIAYTGKQFVDLTLANQNVCETGFHACSAWEMMVIDTVSSTTILEEIAWVAGSFPSYEIHMRSLASGQDSVVCPPGLYLTKFPSRFELGNTRTTGGLHCALQSDSRRVACCANRD